MRPWVRGLAKRATAVVLAGWAAGVMPAQACTNILLMAADGTPVYGRTLRSLNPVDALGWLGRLTAETYSCIDAKNHGRRLQLDYGFLSYGLLARLKDAFIDTTAKGSDHFPLWLELE